MTLFNQYLDHFQNKQLREYLLTIRLEINYLFALLNLQKI
jgi:hypothetical protein